MKSKCIKVLSVIMAVLVCLSFAGCGGKKSLDKIALTYVPTPLNIPSSIFQCGLPSSQLL